MRLLATYILIAFTSINAFSQSTVEQTERAFLIGENEEYFELLVKEHDEQLLNVCNNSMDKAYKAWVSLLTDLEDYAKERDFNLQGIKIWINVFWNADGTIRNIVYYPKPNSKNMDFVLLSEFLSDFSANYQFDTTNEKKFSHYGSASFPIFYSFAQNK